MKENTYAILACVLMVLGLVLVILAWTNVINFPLADWIGWIVGAVGGYFGQIYNSLESKKVSLFQLLVLVACADGDASAEEIKQINEYAKQFDISGKRYESIVKEVAEGKVQFPIPEEIDERKKNIKALVKMANADGNIDSKELALIKEVAKKYSLGEVFVDSLI